MNTRKNLLIVLTSLLAGTTFVILGLTALFTSIRGDKLMAVAFSAAIILFAVYDYTRKPRIIRSKPAPLLRPALPCADNERTRPFVFRRRPARVHSDAA